jgi:hypothetical protein
MSAAEKILNRRPVSRQNAQTTVEALNACRKKLEDLTVAAKNERKKITTTFENFD